MMLTGWRQSWPGRAVALPILVILALLAVVSWVLPIIVGLGLLVVGVILMISPMSSMQSM